MRLSLKFFYMFNIQAHDPTFVTANFVEVFVAWPLHVDDSKSHEVGVTHDFFRNNPLL